MITYGFSIQGKSHKNRGIVCQDASRTLLLNANWYLGVVADGVGSAANAGTGSKTAVNALCEYCKKHMNNGMSDSELEEALERGYEYAFSQIELCAKEAGNSIESYDTTLSSALYDGEKVIYGHAGDGGILVRLYDGIIKPITQRQKGADGSSVIPLRGGNRTWKFGISEGKTAAVLLATDGMLDEVFQPVLLNLPKDKSALARGDFQKNNAYITASEFFMNPYSVYLNEGISDRDSFLEKFVAGDLGDSAENKFMACMKNAYSKMLGAQKAEVICNEIAEYVYAVNAIENVTDDKSVVCIINEEVNVIPQDAYYYREADWQWKQGCYQAFLYGKPLPDEPIRESIEELIDCNEIAYEELPIKSDNDMTEADGGQLKTEYKTLLQECSNLKQKNDLLHKKIVNIKRKAANYRVIAVVSLAVGAVLLIMVFITVHLYNNSKDMIEEYKNELLKTESTNKPSPTPRGSEKKPTPAPKVKDSNNNGTTKYQQAVSDFDELQKKIAEDILNDVKNIDGNKVKKYIAVIKDVFGHNDGMEFSEYFEDILKNEPNITSKPDSTNKADDMSATDDLEFTEADSFRADLIILKYFKDNNLNLLKEKIKAEYEDMENKEQRIIQENLEMLFPEEDI